MMTVNTLGRLWLYMNIPCVERLSDFPIGQRCILASRYVEDTGPEE